MVTESIRSPDTTLASPAMNRIDKPKTLGLLSIRPIVVRITQQPRRHARPQREHEKRNQIARRHRPSPGLIESRSSTNIISANAACQDTALAGGGDIVDHDEEEDGAGDVDKGVDAVDPVEDRRVGEEPFLDRELPEDVQALLDVDELEGVFAGDVDGAFDES